MSNIKASIKIVETQDQISKMILEALLPQTEKYFSNISKNLDSQIIDILINNIKNQPEYDSLINGTLKYEFGLPDAGSRIENIFSSIRSNSVTTIKNPKIYGKTIKASLKIGLVKSNFEDLLALSDATLITEKGTSLEWLRWLLLEGDRIIISGFEFELGPNINSRTSMGIMKPGDVWRVPPEYAGNISNNWITRAINDSANDINNLFKSISRA